MIITEKHLPQEEMVDAAEVELFKSMFPDGMEVTVDNILAAYKAGVDFDWIFLMMLGDDYEHYIPDGLSFCEMARLFALLYFSNQESREERLKNWDTLEPLLRKNFEQVLPAAIEYWSNME